MSARTHTQRCPSRTSAPSLSPPPPDVLICSCAHPHPPHTHPPRTALSAPSLVPPFLPHHPRPNRSVRPRAPRCPLRPTRPHRPTRLPITRRKARTNCTRPHPPCTHRPRPPHTPRRARSFTPRAVLPAIDAHPAPSSPVPAPRRTCARLHPPSLAPPPLIYRFSRAHRAYIVRTRSSPRRSSETAGL